MNKVYPYTYMIHWICYYQKVSQQYYDRSKEGRTEMNHYENYLFTSARGRSMLFWLLEYYNSDGTLKDPENCEIVKIPMIMQSG